MLSVYVPHGASLDRVEVSDGSPVPDSAIWFDLSNPTQAEDKLLERWIRTWRNCVDVYCALVGLPRDGGWRASSGRNSRSAL